MLNDLFPCAQLEFSEYVYNNRLGELFFFTMPDFAPNYVVAVVNSVNRLADFDYCPLLSKSIPFSDMSRIQIESDQIKQEIYDQFDLIYHESNITKLSCCNPQIFKREGTPLGVLKASDYENNDWSIKSPEEPLDMNLYAHKGEKFILRDFIDRNEKSSYKYDKCEQSAYINHCSTSIDKLSQFFIAFILKNYIRILD